MGSKHVVVRSIVGVGLALALTACPEDRPVTRPDANIASLDSGHPSGEDAYTPSGEDAGTTPAEDASTPAGACRSSGGECDLIAQDCPTGQTCIFVILNDAPTPESVCVDIGGTGAEEGQPCCQPNSCDRGLFCVGAVRDGSTCTTQGVCRRYCCGSSTECSVGQRCEPLVSGFAGGICDFADDCNPVTQTGCPTGQGCYPNAGDVGCFAPTDVHGGNGDACSYNNDCDPGFACFGEDPSVCRQFCDMASPSCPAGHSCQGIRDFIAGVGVCMPS